jgi:hypothetical protein
MMTSPWSTANRHRPAPIKTSPSEATTVEEAKVVTVSAAPANTSNSATHPGAAAELSRWRIDPTLRRGGGGGVAS